MSKKIIVVGSGAAGLCIAYYLIRSGYEVQLIEKQNSEYEGCSYGNAGYITPSHFIPLSSPGIVKKGLKWMFKPESPFYIKPRLSKELIDWGWKFFRNSKSRYVNYIAPFLYKLINESLICYKELTSHFNNKFEMKENGILNICKTKRCFDDEIKTSLIANKLGLNTEILSAKETADKEPNIKMNIIGSVYYKDDCHFNPSLFMKEMKSYLITAGVKFIYCNEAIDFKKSKNKIERLITNENEFSGDEFVICCGSWSSLLLKKLNYYLPLQAGKGYSLTLINPKQLPKIPAICIEARVAVTPFSNALRFGGTMEIADLNENFNQARVNGIIKSVNKYFPDYNKNDFEKIKPWFGLRPCSPDGLPYVGRLKLFDNLLVATGHAMLGISLAPITGKLISEIISENKTSIEIEMLNVNRYN